MSLTYVIPDLHGRFDLLRDALAKIEDHAAGNFGILFANTGRAGVVYLVRSALGAHPQRSYTVEPGRQLSDHWAIAAGGSYDLSVSGPNGFLRAFKGSLGGYARADLAITCQYDVADSGVVLKIANRGSFTSSVTVTNSYTRQTISHVLAAGKSTSFAMPLAELFGWYDLFVTVSQDPGFIWQLSGHVENGRDSISDPAMGGAAVMGWID